MDSSLVALLKIIPDEYRGIRQAQYDGWRQAMGRPARAVEQIEKSEFAAIHAMHWHAQGCETMPPKLAACHYFSVLVFGEKLAASALRAARQEDGIEPVAAYMARVNQFLCAAALNYVDVEKRGVYLGKFITWLAGRSANLRKLRKK